MFKQVILATLFAGTITFAEETATAGCVEGKCIKADRECVRVDQDGSRTGKCEKKQLRCGRGKGRGECKRRGKDRAG